MRRHRDRRERQRRVFKMSLIIISSFLGCWAPLSAVNVLILALGPSDGLIRVRLCFLAMAYGTPSPLSRVNLMIGCFSLTLLT